MRIVLPDEVRYIIETLENSGFEAYIVGGCVRDCVMGAEPADWDVCTNALPQQVKEVFDGQQIIDTGLKHGTVTLVLSRKPFEITTYRVDGTYSDNRRPDSVAFVSDLKEDLSRRDFTINAMAYNPRSGIVDLFGGIVDIDVKVVRCVGEADARFREDALRILRALRFASALGFEIEPGTSDAIHRNKVLMQNIAVERIAVELDKMLVGSGAGNMLLGYADVLGVIIPEVCACNSLDAWERTVAGVSNAPPDRALRLAMLLRGAAEPREVLKRLKYDNDTVETVSELISCSDAIIEPQSRDVRRWLSRIGEVRLRQLMEIKKEGAMAEAEETISIIDEVIKQRLCFSLRDLSVNGDDLVKVDIAEGPMIGRVLDRLLEMVIDEQVENDKEALLSLVGDVIREVSKSSD